MLRRLMPDFINRWFAEHYGSRKGFVLTWYHRLLYRAGYYRQYRQVDWGSIDRLVFVCKGNVCRSAFAEVVARANGLNAGSCGIEAGVDVPAYDGAVAAAARSGFSLAEHRTTPLRSMDLRDNDLLVAMEPGQAEYLEQVYGGRHMYTLLGIWGGALNPHLHDPFGASDAYFDSCFTNIEDSVDEIIKKISRAKDSRYS